MHERRTFYANSADQLVGINNAEITVVEIEQTENLQHRRRRRHTDIDDDDDVTNKPATLRQITRLVRRFFSLSPEAAKKMALHAANIFSGTKPTVSAGGGGATASRTDGRTVSEGTGNSEHCSRTNGARNTTRTRVRNSAYARSSATEDDDNNSITAESRNQREVHRTGLSEDASLHKQRSLSHALLDTARSTETIRNRKQLAHNLLARQKARIDLAQHYRDMFANDFNGNELFGERLRRKVVLSQSLQASLSCCASSVDKTKGGVG